MRALLADRRRLMTAGAAGLVLGVATSVPLAAVWPYPGGPRECVRGGEAILYFGRELPLGCTAAYVFFRPAVAGAWAGAGALLGLLAQRLAGRGSACAAAVCAGAVLLAGGFGLAQAPDGMLPPPVVAPALEPWGGPWPLVAEVFAVPTAALACVFTLALALLVGTPRPLATAFGVGAVTDGVHFAAMLAVQLGPAPPAAWPLPWPLGPMVRGLLAANLIAGAFGGVLALLTLTRHGPSRRDGRSA